MQTAIGRQAPMRHSALSGRTDRKTRKKENDTNDTNDAAKEFLFSMAIL